MIKLNQSGSLEVWKFGSLEVWTILYFKTNIRILKPVFEYLKHVRKKEKNPVMSCNFSIFCSVNSVIKLFVIFL